jgi:hypothetical protein
MKRSAKTIICLEDAGSPDEFLSRSAKAYAGEIRVTSVSDMVTKAIAAAEGKLIRRLYVLGHGASGDQSVGSGQSFDPTGSYCLALRSDEFKLRGDAEAHLQRLKGRFTSDAVVTLGGCYVAKGDKGKALLMRVSSLLENVSVDASESLQKPWPGMEGIVVRCNRDVCRVVHEGHEYTREDTEVVEPAWFG